MCPLRGRAGSTARANAAVTSVVAAVTGGAIVALVVAAAAAAAAARLTRATGQLIRLIKAYGIKMILSGEGALSARAAAGR